MKSKIKPVAKRRNNDIIMLFFLLIVSNITNAQIKICGSILDSITGKPISSVHIIENNSKNGTISNEDGNFVITCKNLPVILEFSHISYEKSMIKVDKNSNNQIIKLKSSTYNLPVISINAKKAVNITKNSKLYVIDYDFVGDSIVLLSYKNQKLSKANLVVLTKDGDTLQSKALNKMDYLFKDCFDNEHVIEKDIARQLYFNNQSIELIHPTSKDSFLSIFSVIIENYGKYFYLRQNTTNNQIVNYYIYNRENDSMILMRSIIDEGGLERLSDKARLQSAKGYTEADARFEEMCFYAPKIIEFIKTKEYIIVFNFVNDLMEFYDFDGKFLCEKPIDFHKRKDWAKKVLVDEKNGNLFTLYEKNGMYSVQMISPSNGKLSGNPIRIPEFAFVQKIKVFDNKIYFLYNDLNEYDYKQLYCLKM